MNCLEDTAVTFLQSPLRYPGGKSRAADQLAPLIPPHAEYREPFVGGGGVFLHKPKADRNWINDVHPGLWAFYTAVRDHYDGFASLCRQQKGDVKKRFDYWAGRRDLMKAGRNQNDGDDQIVERAVQYYFINRTVWGGRVVYDPARRSRLYFSNSFGWVHLEKKLDLLKAVSAKLQGVEITCTDFAECLKDMATDTFVYLDPPYTRDSLCHTADKLYDHLFDFRDHRRLAEAVRSTPAKVMISYDDHPDVCQLYDGWNIRELAWTHSGTHAVSAGDRAAGRKEQKRTGNELLIMNYKI